MPAGLASGAAEARHDAATLWRFGNGAAGPHAKDTEHVGFSPQLAGNVMCLDMHTT